MMIGERVIDVQPPARIIIAMRSDGLRERLCKSMRAKDFKISDHGGVRTVE